MTPRSLQRVIPSVATSDGGGVKLRRSLGSSQALRHDPFLMLDEFYSDNPDDYIAGFPPHPHRGFETVTYMLDGHMRHEDSAGNKGDLGPGDVQWMTAAAGIIHSEMPLQTRGRMRGFQLWLNLPAREKVKPAAYRDIPAHQIPVTELENGVSVKVIAGTLVHERGETDGPVQGLTTAPIYLDIRTPSDAVFQTAVPAGHNAFLYVYEGEGTVGHDKQALPKGTAGILTDGDKLQVQAGSAELRVLFFAGKPLGEPIVQHGPFVMNTREEIEQAINDYQTGRLATAQVRRIHDDNPAISSQGKRPQ